MTLSGRLDRIERSLPPAIYSLDELLNCIDNLDIDESFTESEKIGFRSNLLNFGKHYLTIENVLDSMPDNLRRRFIKSLKNERDNTI